MEIELPATESEISAALRGRFGFPVRGVGVSLSRMWASSSKRGQTPHSGVWS